jgi:predicted O-methyltransferase YrrM
MKSTTPVFSQDWFSRNIPTWKVLLQQLHDPSKPFRILEIGVFEGRSTCWLLENHCTKEIDELTVIDTFEGGIENRGLDLTTLKEVFEHNVQCCKSACIVKIHQGLSVHELSKLITTRKDHPGYDFIFVDGSHQAPDVLSDCILSFELLRRGGVMVCDDYLWSMEAPGKEDPINSPKMALDAFTNIFRRKIRIIPNLPIYQLHLQKL